MGLNKTQVYIISLLLVNFLILFFLVVLEGGILEVRFRRGRRKRKGREDEERKERGGK